MANQSDSLISKNIADVSCFWFSTIFGRYGFAWTRLYIGFWRQVANSVPLLCWKSGAAAEQNRTEQRSSILLLLFLHEENPKHKHRKPEEEINTRLDFL